MSRPKPDGLGAALAWLVFPLVPTLLGRSYFETVGFGFSRLSDPRQWDWFVWLLMAGPLWGYGFLAGATLRLDDLPDGRGPRSWLARRSLWVGVGPWVGFLVLSGLLFLNQQGNALLDRLGWSLPAFPGATDAWWDQIARRGIEVGGVGLLGYGWLIVALVALGRARRMGRLRQSWERGLVTALAFVGSLFGSFWAITAAWRSYFFDSRVVPLLAVTLALVGVGGCAAPMTYGEMRRGELFKAMLMAWLLGLAPIWRWWSRPRGRGH